MYNLLLVLKSRLMVVVLTCMHIQLLFLFESITVHDDCIIPGAYQVVVCTKWYSTYMHSCYIM